MLTGFFTVRALSSPHSPAEQLAKLELISLELAALERELPPSLASSPAEAVVGEGVPTGIRESLGAAQLSHHPRLTLVSGLCRLVPAVQARPRAHHLPSCLERGGPAV